MMWMNIMNGNNQLLCTSQQAHCTPRHLREEGLQGLIEPSDMNEINKNEPEELSNRV
jgi:hypothetical protein